MTTKHNTENADRRFNSHSLNVKAIDAAFLKAVAIDVLGAIAMGTVGFALLVIL